MTLGRPLRPVTIIANCHAMSLTRAMSLGARGVRVSFVDLNFLGRENELEVIGRMQAGLPDEAVVFSFPNGPRMSPVSTAELEPLLGARLKTFTNVRFHGLHPDATTLGPRTARRASPMGDYHSKLVVWAWLNGLSERDCARLFDHRIYERVGYFALFEASARTLLERDGPCDVKFAPTFLAHARDAPSLYTFNHPTGAVFQRLAAALCAACEIPFHDFDSSCSINELSGNFIWPIADEIAEAHRLAYRTPQVFVTQQSFDSRTLTLAEFIAGSYAVYGRFDAADFRAVAMREPFWETFAEALG